MSIKERENKIIAQFSTLQTWEEKYKLIIDLGKKLPELPEFLKTEDAKVKGCQSQVWLHAKMGADGLVELQGDSDALIVKGLVGVLFAIYNHSTPSEILMTPPDFLQKIGFAGNLSPSRANGLVAMIKQIQRFAIVFSTVK